ncbi:hypothetical protein BKA93DRAFT_789129 [Sparassis latifolia]
MDPRRRYPPPNLDVSAAAGPSNTRPEFLKTSIARKSGGPAAAPSQREVFTDIHRAVSNNTVLNLSQGRDREPIRVTKVAHGAAQRRDRIEENVYRGITARKAAYSNTSSKLPSSFTYIAPLLHRPARPIKSAPLKPAWMALEEAHTPGSSRKRVGNELSSRSASRITAVMPTPKHAQPTPSKQLLVKRPGFRIPMPPWDGFVVGPDESSSESSEEEVHVPSGGKPPRMQLATKSARKTAAWSHIPSGESSDEEEETSVSGQQSRKNLSATSFRKSREGASEKDAPKSAPKADPFDVIEVSDSSSSPATESANGEEDVEELMAALNALTLPTVRLREYRRLPFLVRNLRRGFRHRCRLAGVQTQPVQPPPAPINVSYIYRPDNDETSEVPDGERVDNDEERVGKMYQWECPLCQLHGQFNTRNMLTFHLGRDHDEVKFTWRETQIDDIQSLTLSLVIPDIDSQESESESEDEDEESASQDVRAGMRASEARVEPERMSPGPAAVAQLAPISSLFDGPAERTTIDLTDIPPSPVLIPKKFRADSPTIKTEARQPSTAQVRKQASTRGSLPERYPTPPPPSDPLAPAAQYPYLPDQSEDGEVYYSCRPGGPRIFDLLNTLPLEPFGVLSWSIVEREEELFELDDVRDEDKVLLALWNRWIMLNRISFVYKGYAKGVIAFIDKYWRMIHRAAGWGALRGFLLMLVANKFLDVSEVVRILKHYENHTGMEYWYKDD